LGSKLVIRNSGESHPWQARKTKVERVWTPRWKTKKPSPGKMRKRDRNGFHKRKVNTDLENRCGKGWVHQMSTCVFGGGEKRERPKRVVKTGKRSMGLAHTKRQVESAHDGEGGLEDLEKGKKEPFE